MNILNLFKKEKRSTQDIMPGYNNPIGLLFGGSESSVGNGMTLSAVYRAVDYISSQVGMIDCNIVRRDNNGYLSIATEHSANILLSKEPNKYTTRHTLFKTIIIDMLLKGNGYIWINRDSRGNAISLYRLSPNDVTITIVDDLPVYTITGKGKVDDSNLIHIKNMSYDGFQGIGTVQFAMQNLSIAKNADNHARNFFSNGCAVGGVLSTESKLNEVQRTEISSSWRKAYGGTGKNGVAVLGSGMKYQPIELDAKDAQLLESREFSVIEIARWFNISPILLYDLTKNSYNTSEASTLEFLQNTLMPILDKIQLEIYSKLFKPSEKKLYDVRFDIESFLKGDLKTMASYYTQLFNMGVLTTNEVRKKLMMNEVEGGNQVFIQSNLVPIDYFKNKTIDTDNVLDNKLKMTEETNN